VRNRRTPFRGRSKTSRYDAIFTSTLRRTQLTAAPLALARDLPITVGAGLHEIEAGTLEGRSDRASVISYLTTAFAWGSGDLDVRMPGAGTGHDFFTRFDADIDRATAGHGTVVVVSHGAAIRVWSAARARNAPPRFADQNKLDNTGVIELTGSVTNGWTLVSWAGMPVGGRELTDTTAEDPTGDTLDAARG